MKALVTLSFSSALHDASRSGVVAAATRALTAFAGDPVRVAFTSGGEHVLISGSDGAESEKTPDGRFAAPLSEGAYTVDGTRIQGTELMRLLASGDGSLARVAPPFAACWCLGPEQPVAAATDTCGLRHLYYWQGDGWATLGTSSLVLAKIADATVDEMAVGAFALVGYHLGQRSSFRGVRKLGPGEMCLLRDGQLEVVAYAPPPDQVPEGYRSFTKAADVGRLTLSKAVRATLDANPGAAMELSGGMDCRAILAAIPPLERIGMPAFTLGVPGSPDHRVASMIAHRWRMDHQFVDTSRLADLAVDEAFELVGRAGRWRDFGRDPLACAALEWVEAQLDQGPRFTGQGGEFFRGEYYPGQRARPHVTDSLVERLAAWRFFTNSAVDPSLFAPEFLADSRAEALATVRGTLGSFDGDWLRACDELYLRVRMQRWAGSEYSASCLSRTVLAPFFHADFLEWGRRTEPAYKRRSQAFNAVLESLDAELAGTPLDTGVAPRDLAHPGLIARAQIAGDRGRKAAVKIRQRLSGRGRAPVGAPLLANLVSQGWATTEGALDRVANQPFMNGAVVKSVAEGRREVGTATVAFLIGLEGTLAFVAR